MIDSVDAGTGSPSLHKAVVAFDRLNLLVDLRILSLPCIYTELFETFILSPRSALTTTFVGTNAQLEIRFNSRKYYCSARIYARMFHEIKIHRYDNPCESYRCFINHSAIRPTEINIKMNFSFLSSKQLPQLQFRQI